MHSLQLTLKQVSKRFSELVNEKYIPVVSIAISADYGLARNRWFLSEDLVNLQEEVFVSLSLDYPCSALRWLQRLKIQGCLPFSDLVRLERYSVLDALDIECLEFGNHVQTVHLRSLRFLRVIKIIRPPGGGYLINSNKMIGVCFGK